MIHCSLSRWVLYYTYQIFHNSESFNREFIRGMIGSLKFSNIFNNKTTSVIVPRFWCALGVSPELGSLDFIWWVFLCLYIVSQEKLFRSETKTTFSSPKDFYLCDRFNCRHFNWRLMLLREELLAQARSLDIICSDLIFITETIHTLSNIFWIKALLIISVVNSKMAMSKVS